MCVREHQIGGSTVTAAKIWLMQKTRTPVSYCWGFLFEL